MAYLLDEDEPYSELACWSEDEEDKAYSVEDQEEYDVDDWESYKSYISDEWPKTSAKNREWWSHRSG